MPSESPRRTTQLVAWVLLGVSLVVAATAGGIYGFHEIQRRRHVTECTANLRKLRLYAAKNHDSWSWVGSGLFPPPEIFNYFAKSTFYEMPPELFVCPAGTESPAFRNEKGRFVLTDEHCSYEGPPDPMAASTKRNLIFYDRRPYHAGSRLVVLRTGRVELLPEAEFQARLRLEKHQ